MNEQNKRIETYLNENEVLGRITELRARGLPEDRIFVFSDDAKDSTKLTAETDVHYKSTEGSSGDRIKSMFSGEDSEEKVLGHFINLSETEKEQYARDLKDGKILLYAEGANADGHRADEYDTSDRQWNNVYGNDEKMTRDTSGPSDANREYADDRTTDKVLRDNEETNIGSSASMDASMWNADESMTDNNHDMDKNRADKEKMELHEEKVDVDKNRRQAGEVEVNKHTEVDKQEFDVPVTKEEVTVERRPVNEVRDDTETKFDESGKYEDNETIRVPVHEEEVEVNKKDVVKEEIVVNKKETKENVHIDEDVRKEEANISDSTREKRRHNDDNSNK